MMATRRPPPIEDLGPETEPMTIAALADRIDGLHVELRQLPIELTSALQQGLITAASDPDTWAAMVRGARSATERHAGRWVLGSVWAVTRKGLLLIALGMIVYSVGGWAALTALFKSAFVAAGDTP